jgi:hypothetical protein
MMDPTQRGTPLDAYKLFRPLVKNSHFFYNTNLGAEEAETLLDPKKTELPIHGAVIGRALLGG